MEKLHGEEEQILSKNALVNAMCAYLCIYMYTIQPLYGPFQLVTHLFILYETFALT